MFLVSVSVLCKHASGFRNTPGKFQTQLHSRFTPLRRFVTHKMSLYTTLLAILVFLLLYGGPFVLPAGHFAKSPWLMSEMCPMSCCNGLDLRGGHIGEFRVLLFIMWCIYIYNISYRM